MILTLRDKQDRIVVHVEIYLKNSVEVGILPDEEFHYDRYVELDSQVIIEPYSELLLNFEYPHFTFGPPASEGIIKDFSDRSFLQGWMWKTYFASDINTGTMEQLNEAHEGVKAKMLAVAEKYDLRYVDSTQS